MTTLSLCIIACNEQDNIAELLTSVRPHVDEIILVDNGSTDRTVDLAQQNGARVLHFKWVDDFSLSRNETLAHATSDWILVLDCDERLSAKDLQAIRTLISTTDKDAFYFLQRNYTNNHTLFGWQPNDKRTSFEKGTGYTDNPIIRLFRNDKNIRFSNPVHEVVDDSLNRIGAGIGKLDIPIHHYGNLKKEEQLKRKAEHYLSISKKQIAKDPANPRPYYEAAKVLKGQGKYEEAQDYFEKAAALNPEYHLVLTNLADTYQKLGLTERAIQTYLRSIKVKPKNENAYINLAILLCTQKKTSTAITLLERALLINPKSAASYHNLSLIYLQQKKYLSALETVNQAIDHTGLEKFKATRQKILPHIQAILATTEHHLRSTLIQEPDNLDHITQLGQIMFLQQRYDEAIELFSTTLKTSETSLFDERKSPLLFNIYSNLATAHEKKGNTQEALFVLNKALTYNPPHKEFFEKRIRDLQPPLP